VIALKPKRKEHGGQPLPESPKGEISQPKSKQEGNMGDHDEDRTLQLLEALVKGQQQMTNEEQQFT
jgi:hypothetical protein